MKNKFFAKVIAFVMAICFVISGTATVPVYAMENDTQAEISVAGNEMVTRSSGLITLDYAKDVEYKHNFDFRNYTQNIPAVKMPNDNRVHRVILKVWFRKDANDNGIGNVKLTVSLIRNGKIDAIVDPVVTTHSETTGGYDEGIFTFTVSPNETVAFDFDASSAGASNGNYRSIDVYRSWVYSD